MRKCLHWRQSHLNGCVSIHSSKGIQQAVRDSGPANLERPHCRCVPVTLPPHLLEPIMQLLRLTREALIDLSEVRMHALVLSRSTVGHGQPALERRSQLLCGSGSAAGR
jgi:hypothetical protein